MAYAGTTLTIHAPEAATIQKKHPAGICASFVCDWLKKLLAKKPLSDLTYADKARVDKLIKRQKKYEGSDDLKTIFKSYGLTFTSDRGVPRENVVEYFEGLPAGYYYISLKFASGFGHALGYNAHGPSFCDPNIGVMDLNGVKISKLIEEAIGIYEEEAGKLQAIYNVTVALAS